MPAFQNLIRDTGRDLDGGDGGGSGEEEDRRFGRKVGKGEFKPGRQIRSATSLYINPFPTVY